ncbi:MAG: hypothetical protein ACI9N3_002277 [Colwellia sp.]|jgi:hypothetical protein
MEYLMNINVLSQDNKVFFFIILLVSAPLQAAQSQNLEMNQWLKARFGAQHQALIPVVAVADMLYSCQQQKKKAEILTIKALITQLDKNTLAEQLITCLAGESPKSDTALNYGLKACFYEQLDHLSLVEKQQKMAVVIQTIATLSRSERQKSFTQCVTDQAIHYLR